MTCSDVPAGEVSHLDPHSGAVTDPVWSPVAARLIRLAGATVVPVFIDGRNSVHFQLAGLIHARLRTLLLARELFNKKHKPIRVRIGRQILFTRLRGIKTDEELAAHLRVKTYVVARRWRERICTSARERQMAGCVVGPTSHPLGFAT